MYRARSAPSERPRYNEQQKKDFRHIWMTLHTVAALRGCQLLSRQQWMRTLQVACEGLRLICARCATHFDRRIAELSDVAPEELELRMYQLHTTLSSSAPQLVPAFTAVKQHYRARAGSGALAAELRRLHGALKAPTTSSSFSRPEQAT